MRQDVKELLARMTVDEKISLACGFDFWLTRAVERLGSLTTFGGVPPEQLQGMVAMLNN